MGGEICILAAFLGRAVLVSSLLWSFAWPERKLRLLCCSRAGGKGAVYNFRTVHSRNFSVTVAVNLVDLGKIRGVILRRLIQPGKLKMGAKKQPVQI